MSLPAAARIRRTRAVPLLAAVVVALTVPVALLVPPQDASGATTAAPVPVPGASVGSPAGIAGRGGEVIVASGDGGDVLAVTGGRSRVLGGGLPRGRFANGPTGVALDRAGDVFVASADEGTVRVFRASGGSGVYASGLGSPIGLAFSDTGDLYVADAGGRRVLRVSPDRRVFRVATGFAEMPYGLAFSPDGRLLVSTQRDGRVFRIATDGGRVAYGKTGGSAEGLVFDRSGRLYVGDGRSGKVVRIDRPGATATTVLSGQNGPINLGVSGSRSSVLLVAVQQTRANVTTDPLTGAVTSSKPDPAGNKVLSLELGRALLAPQRPAVAPTSVPFFAGNQAFRAGGVSLQPRTAVPVATRTDIGREAAEPTIGVTRKGNVFITAATFDGPAGRLARTELRGSFDRGKTFRDVTERILGTDAPPATLDPFVFVDPTTNRIFNDDLTLACSNLAISDNEGKSFTPNPVACSFPVNDHQSITTGKPTKGLQTIGYPNVVYFCGINAIAATTCARSLDGGRTFVAGGPAYPGVDPTSNNRFCGGLSGHTQTGPDGTVYVPRVFCDTPNVAISTDNGTTFQRVVVSKVKSQPFDHEAGIALDGRGNAYYTYVAFDRLPRLVISRDRGRTWGKPLIINPPEVAQANLPAIAVSGAGQVTVSFYGSANRCCYKLDAKDPGSRENDQARWSTYVVTTSNALAASPTFYGVTVDPRTDPSVKQACGPGRCGNALDFLGVVIDNRHEVWSSSVDTCTPKAGSPTSGPGRGVVETRNCVTDPLAAQNNRRGIAAHFTLPAATAGSDYPMSPVIGGPPKINPVIGAGPPRDRAPGTGTGTGTSTGDRGSLATTGLPGTLLLCASGLLLAAAGLARLRRA